MSVDLSGLRDIHIPVRPSWWPPALGWWLLLGGILLTLLFGYILYRIWCRFPKQYALHELKSIYKQKKNSVEMARQVSLLFKRIVLLKYPRKKVASLTPDQWMDFLQSKTGRLFSEDQLRLLALSAYMPDKLLPAGDMDALYQSARKAVKQLFKGEKHGTRKKST